MSTSSDHNALILAPVGADALNSARVLAEAGIGSEICKDLPDLCGRIERGAGMALLSEEVLFPHSISMLLHALHKQPKWSDIPVILVLKPGARKDPASPGLMDFIRASNSTVLERPLRLLILISTVQAALRSRKRQYEVRDLLQQRDAIITERTMAEQALSYQHLTLERRVAERTASLKETVESLEGVCYTIAHDLRAPLRALEGFTEILFSGNEHRFDEEELGYAKRIMAAATGMDLLINDLLDYARLSHQELPCKPIDLNLKLSSIVDQLSSEILAKAARVRVNELPIIWANETVVEQVFMNLLTNALKFVEQGKAPEIEISAETDDTRARIYVKDNGIGIAPEHQERVFGAFQRLHKATQYPGTGIGLAIVKKGVERMGGRIYLESKPGHGSCFRIEFRMVRQET